MIRRPSNSSIRDALRRSGVYHLDDRQRSRLLAALRRVTPKLTLRYTEQKVPAFFALRPMLTPLLIILAVLTASVGTVAAADKAKPGDFLFPVDQAIETLQLKLSVSSSGRAEVAANIAEERTAEAEALATQGAIARLPVASDRVDEALSRAQETVAEVRAKVEAQGSSRGRERLSRVESKLRTLQERRGSSLKAAHKTKVEVEVENNVAKVKVELGEAEFRFVLPTTDETTIVREIARRTGLSEEAIRSIIRIEVEPQVEEKGLAEVEVDIGCRTTVVEVEVDDVESTFTLETTDEVTIVREIATRTGATEARVRQLLQIDREDECGLTEAEVEIRGNLAVVEVEVDGVESTFTLNTTDIDAIIREIALRTGATEAQVRAVIEIEREEPKLNVNNQGPGNAETLQWEIGVEVDLGDNEAKIRARLGDLERLEWELSTTDRNAIAQSIASKTGLTTAQVMSIWEFEIKDED